MRTRPQIAALVVSFRMFLAGRLVDAQPDLPPPPPPPIDQPVELPSLPPPPAPPVRSSPARRAVPTPPPPPPPYRAAVRPHRVDEVVYVEPPVSHPVAVTLNPLGLPWARLSGNVEVQLEPHHSLVASLNVLVARANRGGASDLVSEGLGFASDASNGVGIEFGYHYWLRWERALRGPFLGPSLLLGSTSAASVGDPTHAQAYWGLAFDGGWQEVLPGGFTLGAGGGLEWIRMAGFGAVVPRLLLQIGWSF